MLQSGIPAGKQLGFHWKELHFSGALRCQPYSFRRQVSATALRSCVIIAICILFHIPFKSLQSAWYG